MELPQRGQTSGAFHSRQLWLESLSHFIRTSKKFSSLSPANSMSDSSKPLNTAATTSINSLQSKQRIVCVQWHSPASRPPDTSTAYPHTGQENSKRRPMTLRTCHILCQRASDCPTISSNSALVSPLPKLNVPVRCFQSSSDRP